MMLESCACLGNHSGGSLPRQDYSVRPDSRRLPERYPFTVPIRIIFFVAKGWTVLNADTLGLWKDAKLKSTTNQDALIELKEKRCILLCWV